MGRGQVTNFDHCLHIVMVIGKCTDVFRGTFFLGRGGGLRGEDYVGRIFPWRNLSWGKRISMKGCAGFSSII